MLERMFKKVRFLFQTTSNHPLQITSQVQKMASKNTTRSLSLDWYQSLGLKIHMITDNINFLTS